MCQTVFRETLCNEIVIGVPLMHFQIACSGFVIRICTIKFMVCPAEKTSISLGPLAFSKYVYRTLAEEWGHLLSSCLKRSSIAHLVSVDRVQFWDQAVLSGDTIHLRTLGRWT